MLQMQHALADWGREMGLPALEAGPGGEVQLRLESGALLGVAAVDEGVLVHWAQPVRHGGGSLMLRALQQAGATRGAGRPVQVGLRTLPGAEWLVVGTRVPELDVSARGLREAAEFLRQWLEALEG